MLKHTHPGALLPATAILAAALLTGCPRKQQSPPPSAADGGVSYSGNDTTPAGVTPAHDETGNAPGGDHAGDADAAADGSAHSASGDSPGANTDHPGAGNNGAENGGPHTDSTRPPNQQPKGGDLPRVVWKPRVILSEAHRKTCVVGVGDAMPDITLPDLDGKEQKLADLYGRQLTVVVFWSSRYRYAREQFVRLQHEVADRYASLGVAVVAINEGDAADEVRQLAADSGATFPVLLDADTAALKSVATGKVPRTYLLDSQGRILWLDIEYSRSTARELRNAIGYRFHRGAI